MTETLDSPRIALWRRWWLLTALAVAAILAAIWFIRAATWPCGALDRSSGCVSSVTLDVAALGYDPDVAWISWRGFDLSADGEIAVVPIWQNYSDSRRSTLALFNAETGAMLRILYDDTVSRSFPRGNTMIGEVALSPDGSLVAAATLTGSSGDEIGTLSVYDTTDGGLSKTLKLPEEEFLGCNGRLDFSTDGTKLQCGDDLHDLATGTVSSLLRNGEVVYPVPADEFFMQNATAPDGTRIDMWDVGSPVRAVFRNHENPPEASAGWAVFAPDSAGLLEVWVVDRDTFRYPFYVPAVFRVMSGVAIWDGKTRQLQGSFYSNRRYRFSAWSRGSTYFGFVSDDFQLEVFRR